MPPSRMAAKPSTPRKQSKLNFGSASAKPGNQATASAKKGANGNILSFFKKLDVEEQLFCDGAAPTLPRSTEVPIHDDNEDIYGAEAKAEDSRFNESQTASKKRKLSPESCDKPSQGDNDEGTLRARRDTDLQSPGRRSSAPKVPKKSAPRKGPFLDDSDSENDETPTANTKSEEADRKSLLSVDTPALSTKSKSSVVKEPPIEPEIPELKKEKTSTYEAFQDLEDMEQLFDNDEFEEGEEYRERQYMEQQALLEAQEDGHFGPDDAPVDESMAGACPLCSFSFAGLNAEQATAHANACLDGNPLSAAETTPITEAPVEAVATSAGELSKRFSRAAVPRPGQSNPINLGNTKSAPATSAYSKLMSANAEDSAWASAAAAENASRGKQAYQRTCPFYKIMPGFFICVDAFRYGAVKDCNAYFLSHFHSDHYIGLTANWSHGPIYCSQVTASLIRSQLKTDAKWLKPLEFEEKTDIPGTQGVTVTMIPANHCPGSSLFLFEKGPNRGSDRKTQRILHCGDFRACPAQIGHPLLKPETVDSISGNNRQQRIDVCYLDTTYLNPRYSFPPQNDVINTCAEFCRALSGDPSIADETFDALRRERGTTDVSKFFHKDPTAKSKGNDSFATVLGQQTLTPHPKNRLLVICGTYSIGKERICKAIAQALNTKIYASPAKIKICSQLGDPELAGLMTSNPREAQVHMQMLMEIRAETLQDYLDGYKPHFTRIVGFRPSGWNFRGGGVAGGNGSGAANAHQSAASVPANVSPSTVATTSILHGTGWRTRFSTRDLVAQRGSTREAMCFGVPYSEHSSFRELALFVMSLRIDKVVPTVNVGSEASRKRMKAWLDRWVSERRKGGLVRPIFEDNDHGDGGGGGGGGGGKDTTTKKTAAVDDDDDDDDPWDGKGSKGGSVQW